MLLCTIAFYVIFVHKKNHLEARPKKDPNGFAKPLSGLFWGTEEYMKEYSQNKLLIASATLSASYEQENVTLSLGYIDLSAQ